MKIDYKPLQHFFDKWGDQLTQNQSDAICKLYAQSIVMHDRPMPDLTQFLDNFQDKDEEKEFIWDLQKLKNKNAKEVDEDTTDNTTS